MDIIERDTNKLVLRLGPVEFTFFKNFEGIASGKKYLCEISARERDCKEDYAHGYEKEYDLTIERSTLHEDVIEPLLAHSDQLVAVQKLLIEYATFVKVARALHEQLRQRTIVSEGTNGSDFFKAWNKFSAMLEQKGASNGVHRKGL